MGLVGGKSHKTLFYCSTLPVIHTVDQCRIFNFKKLKCHNSVLLRVIAKLCHNDIVSVAAKYETSCLDMSDSSIKKRTVRVFGRILVIQLFKYMCEVQDC